MTPSHRAWTERFVGDLEDRLALYARIGIGREGEVTIVAVLQSIVDRHRIALRAAGPTIVAPTAAPADAHADRPCRPMTGLGPVAGTTDWTNPVFWSDGYFRPFAGTRRDVMLASAATCRRLGYDAAAQAYDALAADPDPDAIAVVTPIAIDAAAQARLATVAAFTAGPQMGLFG